MRAIAIATCAGALLWAGAAWGQCQPPSPPAASERPPRPEQPRPPACAATNTCNGTEVSAFNKAVADYNVRARAWQAAAQAYANRLTAYGQAAQEYVKCEVRELNGGADPAP